jgi:hypothetical protein
MPHIITALLYGGRVDLLTVHFCSISAFNKAFNKVQDKATGFPGAEL